MPQFRNAQINELTSRIIGAAIDVHRGLGPGLLESAYHACIKYELRQRGLQFESDKKLPILYKGVIVDCGYRIDLLIEQLVIVELKCVTHLAPIHQAQLLTYLKLARLPIGLLLNFNVPVLKEGIQRAFNNEHQLVDET